MSLLARAPQLAARSRVFIPARNMSSHGHGEYKHMPFNYNKTGVFGAKLALYLATGFTIPFVAVAYQLSKH